MAVNKAKVALNRRGIDARKGEREGKKQIQNIQVQGGIMPSELLIAIPDPQKNPTAPDLKSLQVSFDLLQALLLLSPSAINRSNVIDPQLQEDDNQQIANNGRAASGITVSDDEDLGCESYSDSSCMSDDSMTRNADFLSLN